MAADEPLGKARLDLTADLGDFEANVAAAKKTSRGLGDSLDALAAVANIAERELNRVKMSAESGAESKAAAEGILSSVRGISEKAVAAARELDRIRLTETQATETEISADRMKESVRGLGTEADKTSAKLKVMNRESRGGGSTVGGTNIGILGAAIGAGTLVTPAAGPAVLGLLGAIPVLATSGAGALGVLALAFQGVDKAIMGDKKAFDDLGPAAQQFVLTIRSLDGWFDKLKETAASSLFPGLTAGLKAALSPGTVQAITVAVQEFGTALGQVGEQVGKYFGSAEFRSIFGPLMQAGAQNLKTLAAAALSLMDAVGVLARAAIPFTRWLVESIAAGARWVDTFVHAKDATGQLSGAMTEAKTSLTLVANLFSSLVHAVAALGTALYPVSKVAVKDLTDGLNALAGIIDRNKQTIQEVVSGALAALVSTVRVLTPIVGSLAKALKGVVGAIGGWKVAFEIIIGGFLATKLVALSGTVIGFGGSITTAATKLGMLGLAAETSASEVGGLRAALIGLGSAEVLGPLALAAAGVAAIAYGFDSASKHLRSVQVNGGLLTQDTNTGQYSFRPSTANRGSTRPHPLSNAEAAALLAAAGASLGSNSSDPHFKGTLPGAGADWMFTGKSTAGESSTLIAAMQGLSQHYGNAQIDVISGYRSDAQQTALWDASVRAGHPGRMPNGNPIARPQSRGGAGSDHESGNALDGQIKINGRWVPLSSLPPSVLAKYGLTSVSGDTNHVQLSGLPTSTSPFGTVPPFTTNTGPSGQPTAKQQAAAAAKALAARLQIPVTNDQTQVAHFKALAAAANTGPAIDRYLTDEISALKKENVDLGKSMQGKTALQKARIRGQISKNEDEITKLHASVLEAVKMAADASAFNKFSVHLKALTAKFTADSDYATVLTGAVAEKYQQTLLGDLHSQASVLRAEQAKLQAKLATATGKHKAEIKSELAQVTADLDSVQQQVLSSLEGTVQTLQGKVATVFQQVVSELDAQFEAQTQKMIDAAGVQFFQNGAQTPLEKQLADMQAADQLGSLQDAVTSATDPKARAAAQRQLDEYQLGIRATAQRAKADADYAAATKRIQAARDKAEAAMNKQLALLSDQFANGTGSMTDLAKVAAEYGVQITTDTIPDFDGLSTASNTLIVAFQQLADYIAKITGNAPAQPPSGSSPPRFRSYADIVGSLGGTGLGGRLPSPDVGSSTLAKGLAQAAIATPTAATVARGMGVGGDIVLHVDGRELARANADGLARNPAATRITAKVVKPALARVVTV